MLRPQYGVKMLPVSVVQEVEVIDRILRHLWQVGGNNPWEGTTLRGPPAADRLPPLYGSAVYVGTVSYRLSFG